MGKEIPSESRAPFSADFSKVLDGGVTKVQQPLKGSKPMSREDEVRLSEVVAGISNGHAEAASKPEVIDLDSGSDDADELNGSEGADDEEDEDEEDGDEDEDEEWADDAWKDEWEDEGDDVTKVQLPQPKPPPSSLTTRAAYIVTSVHEIRDPYEDKFHEVLGVYSHAPDANRAAQEYARGQGFTQDGGRYKERVHLDGTFHARGKGGRDERISVDVEAKQYTVREEVAA